MSTSGLRVAIVGGGIGGVAAALALRARGMDVTVYERAAELREIGAGIGLGSNATRLLGRIGLGPGLQSIASPPAKFVMRTWTGEPIANLPTVLLAPGCGLGTGYMFHRAELLDVLVKALPAGTLRLEHRCTGAVETDAGVELTFASGATAAADLVIGADGVHSVIRGAIGVLSEPKSEGIMAYRGLIPVARLSWAKKVSTAMWMGPKRSFLAFAVSRGRMMNIVAFVPTDRDSPESWRAPGDVSALAAEYAGWDADVQETIRALDETFIWGIYDRAPLPRWSTRRITLLGDAAHPMTPHLGQGAGQSIEDGFALAVFLEGAPAAELPSRLHAYETLRREHTSRVQARARTAGQLYRADDVDVAERDVKLWELFEENRWMYEYDAEQVAKEALEAMPGRGRSEREAERGGLDARPARP
jgi:2-polyprenyl-6-methoxyphenol hydroxylase-like FAD-dependent oxidoreductase